MEFQPQKVESNSWRLWFKEGLSLSTRKIGVFIAIPLMFGLLHYLPDFLGVLFIVSMPLALGFGCVAAYCADESKDFFGIGIILVGPMLMRRWKERNY